MLWSLLFITLIGPSSQDCPGWETLRLNDKLSFQSSVYTDNHGLSFSAGRALDGNPSTCSDSLEQPNSWWTVDLLGLYEISCITIKNLIQSNIDLRGARILIGNSSEINLTANTECATINTTTSGETTTFNCVNGTKWGRYVTVYKQSNGPLILCEVTIQVTKKDLPFKLIKEKKTWEDALSSCREKYVDLVSILDRETQGWVELEAQKADTPFVWLGLHYTCGLGFWLWVNNECVIFNQWTPDKTRTAECGMSGAMNTSGSHSWYMKSDYDEFNFICKV